MAMCALYEQIYCYYGDIMDIIQTMGLFAVTKDLCNMTRYYDPDECSILFSMLWSVSRADLIHTILPVCAMRSTI